MHASSGCRTSNAVFSTRTRDARLAAATPQRRNAPFCSLRLPPAPQQVKGVTPLVPEESVPFVGEALRQLRAEVGNASTVLGFVGAPFTLATYIVEGGWAGGRAGGWLGGWLAGWVGGRVGGWVGGQVRRGGGIRGRHGIARRRHQQGCSSSGSSSGQRSRGEGRRFGCRGRGSGRRCGTEGCRGSCGRGV